MITLVFAVLAALAIGFTVLVSRQPSEFRVVRTARIAAAPATLFSYINDFRKWETWSPWAKLDPEARNSFDGKAEGVGAIFAWSGNSKVGEGRITITESRPSEFVGMELDFFKPFKATNTAEFILRPDGDRTLVEWSMSGRANFVAKAMGLFLNCEKMAGAQFEKGLSNLKSVTEDRVVVTP
jgi:hypothetical protein